MLQNSENETNKTCLAKKSKFIRTQFIYFIFVFVAIAVPWLATYNILKPSNEDSLIWFQRSGSLMVIFSVFAEVYVMKMRAIIEPSSGFTCSDCIKLNETYSNQVSIYKRISIILIISGTVVWGYGDVFIKFFAQL